MRGCTGARLCTYPIGEFVVVHRSTAAFKLALLGWLIGRASFFPTNHACAAEGKWARLTHLNAPPDDPISGLNISH